MFEAMAHFAVEPFAAYFALGEMPKSSDRPAPRPGLHPAHGGRPAARDPPVLAREVLAGTDRPRSRRASSSMDARFAERLARIQNYEALGQELDRRFRKRPLADWADSPVGERRALRADQRHRRGRERPAGAPPRARRAGRGGAIEGGREAVRPALQFDGKRATSVTARAAPQPAWRCDPRGARSETAAGRAAPSDGIARRAQDDPHG